MKIEIETLLIYKSLFQLDVDTIDRLNSRYTTLALIGCFLIILGKIYVGNPINCWGPTQFQSVHFTYVNSICWLKGTYYLPTKEIEIPDRSVPRMYHVSYYQWTTIALLLMAFLFTLPGHTWQTFSSQRGVNLKNLVKMVKENRHSRKELDYVLRLIKAQLDITRIKRSRTLSHLKCRVVNPMGRLTLLLFIVKFFYIMNTLGQLLFLINFLSLRRTDLNGNIIGRLFGDRMYTYESARFPHVVICDFMIRELGSNQHWYAVQCNLPINIYNEMIFSVLVIWLIILSIANIFSIIFWIFLLTKKNRKRFIIQCLQMYESVETKMMINKKSLTESHFIDYIGLDGFVILRVIGQNINELCMIETMSYLYKHYKGNLGDVNDQSEDHIV
ncbi:unnamed protein product [Adineta ricciae]|uniref:Innexin n=1 Tax=Adineta ricciae TaxID=249248 RepID=A0A814T317_ADIRI|nr:unnamed protein product [Adineta ricciae]